MKTAEMKLNREIVSEAEWLIARRDLLARKKFTRRERAQRAGMGESARPILISRGKPRALWQEHQKETL